MTTEYFTLKDGVIGWIENMPKHEWIYYCRSDFACDSDFEEHQHHEVEYTRRHQQALQSAISNAIEVENEREVKDAIGNKYALFQSVRNGWSIEKGKVYALQCHVEKKQISTSRAISAFPGKTVALVTFPSSAGVEETQEGMISVFVLDMHGSKVYDTLKSNLLGMIECEIENLERGEFEELDINITRIQMTQAEYENLPEFSGY